MTRIWLFLHYSGFIMWTGGGLAAMVAGFSARGGTRAALGAVSRAQAAIHRRIIAPGAILVVLSGLILTVRYMGAMTTPMSPWLMVMQGTGVLGALVSLLVSLPTASRLARIDAEGQHGAYFDELRGRLRVSASLAGLLALAGVVSAVMLRTGA